VVAVANVRWSRGFQHSDLIWKLTVVEVVVHERCSQPEEHPASRAFSCGTYVFCLRKKAIKEALLAGCQRCDCFLEHSVLPVVISLFNKKKRGKAVFVHLPSHENVFLP